VETFWPVPDNEYVTTGLRQLSEKNVNLCLVYYSGGPAHFNYTRNYAKTVDSLKKYDNIQINLVEDTDHLFSPLHVQKILLDTIYNWAVRSASSLKTETQNV
jgi:hypothetical protein